MTTPTFDPQPCCGDAAGAACMQPMQFCQTSTTTGPVEHPGRVYDLTLPINPGFTVDQLIQDEVTQNAGITWSIFDPDGSAFANELRDFIQSRMAGTTVTVTNPNAGTPQVCGNALPMQVHIECLRIDQDPPNLVELVFNAGADLIQNPAYNENPPLNPPVAQGNYGFHLLSRQDDPGPFPGNQPSNDALCTSVANRGWETNDVGRTFEIWGQDVASAQNTTPTPRGTPVQEMTSDGPPPGGISTVWQTFNVLAPGTFNIRVVHGARDPGETHRITLSTGDTDDNQVGDVINDVTTPPSVTSSGGPNPWTTFNQSIPLNAGTYTLALSSTDPSPDARGGLFTDMRVFLDRPNTRATAVNDDETCTVTAEETTTSSVCTFWTPGCEGGQIATWTNTETGATLTNTEFWAQTPKPSCCDGAAAAPGGNGVQSNLVVSDIVCAVIGGIQQNVVREVLFDASGGELEVAFIGANGARLNPDSWTPGDCVSQRDMHDVILCDQQADGTTVSFLRKYVQTWSPTLGAQVNEIRDFTIGPDVHVHGDRHGGQLCADRQHGAGCGVVRRGREQPAVPAPLPAHRRRDDRLRGFDAGRVDPVRSGGPGRRVLERWRLHDYGPLPRRRDPDRRRQPADRDRHGGAGRVDQPADGHVLGGASPGRNHVLRDARQHSELGRAVRHHDRHGHRERPGDHPVQLQP
ncbi:hypothetical protein SEA_XKCD426_17 [Streptomyces phage Xkcd426]|nr:hypothetical protein SEA_XKCD426_17 [Streptomyces phage Xkcd426]